MKVTKITAAIGISLIVLGLGFLGCSQNQTIQNTNNNKDFARTSVMVTLVNGKSGGSGVILSSSPSGSVILTNKHVINLIQNGGLVKTETGAYPIASFKVYPKHDLGLILVQTDLGVNTRIATSAPAKYSSLSVAGHPALLPTAVTGGHFSSRMPIQMMVDMEPCDGKEEGQDVLYCMFVGGKPIIQQFDAQFTTTTIMPGSSGSGVFNDKGELSGLVFAGPGDGLGYGFIVPFEYVKDFVTTLDSYPTHVPDSKGKPVNFFKNLENLVAYCKFDSQSTICDNLKFQEIFIND